jgi:hypothetical protein
VYVLVVRGVGRFGRDLEEILGLVPHTFSGGIEINHENPSIRKTGFPFETVSANAYHYSATVGRPCNLSFGFRPKHRRVLLLPSRIHRPIFRFPH